jgi:hypothetical protein
LPMVFGSHFWTPGLTPFSTRRGTRRGHPGTRRGHPGTRGGHPGTRIGPSWDAYGPSWDPWGSSWDAYRAILGRVWASLGRVWASLGRVWACLGRVWARVWACLGRVWADRARKRAPRVRRHVTSPPDKRFRARARKSRQSVSRAATFKRLLPRRVYCMLFCLSKTKERERERYFTSTPHLGTFRQPASQLAIELSKILWSRKQSRFGLCGCGSTPK